MWEVGGTRSPFARASTRRVQVRGLDMNSIVQAWAVVVVHARVQAEAEHMRTVEAAFSMRSADGELAERVWVPVRGGKIERKRSEPNAPQTGQQRQDLL